MLPLDRFVYKFTSYEKVGTILSETSTIETFVVVAVVVVVDIRSGGEVVKGSLNNLRAVVMFFLMSKRVGGKKDGTGQIFSQT